MLQLKQGLLDDHSKLEAELRALADSVAANDSCSDLSCVWASFESHLLEPGREERNLFPLVAHEHRAEIEALRGEHRRIRQVVTDLGVCVELHTLRKSAIDELIEFLEGHADREAHSLYEWSESESKNLSLSGVFAMLARHAPPERVPSKSRRDTAAPFLDREKQRKCPGRAAR
ncbi:MAG TPA: hemerythrin domain-containing protein [Polyangiaceae bacterium]|jgi:hypothetical protein|nr:hemerythrin domain-containing protein [Polyangiaceae bacterium]